MKLEANGKPKEPARVTIAHKSFGSAVLHIKRIMWADTSGQIGIRNDAEVAGKSPGKADAEYVVRTAIVGWSDVFVDVVQPDGSVEKKTVPFSQEAFSDACSSHPLFAWMAWRAADNAFSGITEDIAGNSPAPSDNGSETAGATTPESTAGSGSEPSG